MICRFGCVESRGRRESVEGALDSDAGALKDVRVDLCRFDGFVAEEVLDRADVGAVFEQVSGEGVAEDVWGDPFMEVGALSGGADDILEGRVGEVVAAEGAGDRVGGERFGGEEPLPFPGFAGALVFSGESVGEPDPVEIVFSIFEEERVEGREVVLEEGEEFDGEDRDAVLVAFAGEDVDLAALEVEVVDAEAEEFEEAEAGAVHKFGHEARGAGEVGKECCDLGWGEDRGDAAFGVGAVEGQLAQGDVEGVLEEELESVEGLALGGGGGAGGEGEVGEESFDVVGGGFVGGEGVDEFGEASGPAAVGFLCAVEQVAGAGRRDQFGFPG